ncbi:SpvB/TcaC N-terminal domain-containing protein [Paraburkholderia sediminicola]|uniref:SpvB/TcaC N-terminal domain-containing protein n=1 Tax=Paraburkholderia sediminicola TaxID=458836 RepID=UPI0038BDC4EB
MPDNAGSTSPEAASQGASEFRAPTISLPQGGGAIRGIDEKFAANPFTGAGALSVPIATSKGRSGFGPELSLSYDSSGSNGPFGFGWNFSLPSITRRTDKGLPRYADCEESDIFILSGSEDLVPLLARDEDGHWIDEPTSPREGYAIKSYRPRTEGLFARIERWTRLDDGATHWRSISKDNILTVYGFDADSQIADPRKPKHVFSWLICRSFDDKGNAISYDYAEENGEGVGVDLASERHRDRSANRYVQRIRYGNRVPLLFDPDTPDLRKPHVEQHDVDAAQWMFSLVFDYGEGRYEEEEPDGDGRIFTSASYDAQRPWSVRRDPFSSFRSCFEMRTYRLCRHALMFHHFPEELGEENYLVRSTSFEYDEKPIGSFLKQVKQSGHTLAEDGRYLTRSLPTLDLTYTSSPLEDPDCKGFEIRDVDGESLRNLPSGIDGGSYRFLDLDGVGISGVLTEQDRSWFYKPNLGGGRLSETAAVSVRPALATLSDGAHHLMDLAGDSNLDLVDFSSSSPGYYERNIEGGWEGFRAFRSMPVLDWSDPNLRFVDVTGDGIADILITEDDAVKWHASLLNEGYGEAVRVHIPLEGEESGPRVVFADGTQSIYLANMTGDGLSDLVRIRNGEVCYWPNLGYGHFGARIIMDRSPWFDEVDLFDQRRIRLADTDGSGTSDILYLGHSGVEVFLNETGNAWSSARRVDPFPAVDNVAAVDVMDFLGRGTACLLWSSPLPGAQGRQLRYLDLMCGRKPHLLECVVNYAGAETRIEYASSTEFYLADQAAGMPWVTRLPFPVHVVKRVETFDEVSRNRFVSRYTYHHGFYDGLEREFRGFGRVDQLDTEDIASLMAPGTFPTGDNIDATSSVPPVLTKTWTHTGVFLASGRISRHMAHEYFQDDAPLDDTILPAGLTPYETREACRALKGSTLRQEVYALDGTAKAQIPYSVAESNFTIRTVQPLAANRYAVFFTHPRETITFHYERDPDDPRIGHVLTLAVDEYGNVLTSASIGYGRRKPAFDEQGQVLATLSEHQHTNAILQPDAYRTPIPSQVSTYELTAPELRGAQPLEFNAVEFLVAYANEIPYDAKATGGEIEKRLIERQRSLYRKNDLEGLLPLGRVESMALPGESYKLALTSGLLDVFRAKTTPGEMRSILSGAQYRDLDGDGPFWIPSDQAFYSPDVDDTALQELAYARAHFFLPHRFRDPFGNATIVAYDEKYNLSLVYTRDAAGNETASEPDYRVLQPRQVTDPNGNRAQARFDALGMLAGTALLGKAIGTVEGDSFDRFVTDLTPSQVQAFFDADDPYALASEHLGTATTRILYDLKRIPMCAASIARETHVSDLAPGERSRVQLHFVYSDGFGREAQSKIQAEPGPLRPDDPGSPVVNPRWVGSGAKIYNNKGKPVREYEPFFSPTSQFGIEEWGVSNTLFYDPVLRVVATLHPNNTYEKVVFDPWKQITFDVNDTVTFDPKTDKDVGEYFSRLPDSDYLPTWFQQRIDGMEGPHERTAAIEASKDANTPTVAHFDSLGRTVLSIADNGDGQYFRTRSVLDIEGNQQAVIDSLDRVAMRYDYDMISTRIHQASMEAGERWMLNDAAGKPVRAWNSREFAFRTEYDDLRRPVKSFVRGETLSHEILFELTIYGERPETGLSEAQRKQANLRGKAFRHFDGAGVVVTDLNDFKGNPLHSARRFTREYKHAPDWSRPQPFESRTYASEMKYDALNRAIAVTAPDGSIYRPKYNDANLLEVVDVNLRGAAQNGRPFWTPFITYINYDAKGQRTICRYANSMETTYEYDPKTFRLMHLKTMRKTVESGRSAKIFRHHNTIQDLHYTYDPVGNITRIEDGALKTVFHANQEVDPICEYEYDPVYRLVEAKGREHIGQSALNFFPDQGDNRDYPFEGAARLNDLQALQRYTECYSYDPAGNFLKMFHRAAHRNWTRAYTYCEASLLEPLRNSNRLNETSIETHLGAPVERYSYDAHGNMARMPHLPLMMWNYKDQLSATSRQVVNSGEPETTYYVYDASGQRTRKVTESECGKRSSERFYVSGFEVFRAYSGCEVAMERETLHIMDDKQRIALVETKTIEDGDAIQAPTPEQRYQLANHLGSASVEVDEAGGLITYEEYSPYGNTTYQFGSDAGEVQRKRYRYTGKERDQENGLMYHGARYYAPWLGRWTSCDPSGIEGGVNLYAYVEARPTIAADPTGQIIWFFVAAVVIIATLTAVSEAGAPTNERDARAVKPHISDEEFAAHTAVTGVSMAVGGAAGNAMKGAPVVLQGVVGGAVGGGVQGAGDQAVQDVKKGEVSSVRKYADTTIKSAAAGAVVGGALAAGGQVVGKGISLIKPGESANTPTPPADPYDVEAWNKFHAENPTAKRSVGAAAADDPSVFGKKASASTPAVRKMPPGPPPSESEITVQPKRGPQNTQRNASALADKGMRVGNAYPRDPLHHVLPQKFRAFFKSKGLDVDDYAVAITEGEHSAIHTMKWNPKWAKWIEDNQGASKAEIFKFARKMMDEFKLNNRPFTRYTRTR